VGQLLLQGADAPITRTKIDGFPDNAGVQALYINGVKIFDGPPPVAPTVTWRNAAQVWYPSNNGLGIVRPIVGRYNPSLLSPVNILVESADYRVLQVRRIDGELAYIILKVFNINSSNGHWTNTSVTDVQISAIEDTSVAGAFSEFTYVLDTSALDGQPLISNAISIEPVAVDGTVPMVIDVFSDSSTLLYYDFTSAVDLISGISSTYYTGGIEVPFADATTTTAQRADTIAVQFTGTDESTQLWMSLGTALQTQLSTGTYSISFWALHDGVSEEATIFSQDSLLSIAKSDVASQDVPRLYSINSETPTWVHYCITSVATDFGVDTKFFVNGVLIHGRRTPSSVITSDTIFGRSVDGTKSYYGAVSSVRLFNRNLLQDEIAIMVQYGY